MIVKGIIYKNNLPFIDLCISTALVKLPLAFDHCFCCGGGGDKIHPISLLSTAFSDIRYTHIVV